MEISPGFARLLHNTLNRNCSSLTQVHKSLHYEVFYHSLVIFSAAKKGAVGKSKEELTLEKRQELERRLQDVSGQLNSVKKPTKPKGELPHHLLKYTHVHIMLLLLLQGHHSHLTQIKSESVYSFRMYLLLYCTFQFNFICTIVRTTVDLRVYSSFFLPLSCASIIL